MAYWERFPFHTEIEEEEEWQIIDHNKNIFEKHSKMWRKLETTTLTNDKNSCWRCSSHGILRALFFPRVILYTFFWFSLNYGGLGVGVLGLGNWSVFGVGVFSWWGFGPVGFLELGSLYEHRRINLGKNVAFYASVNFFLFEWIYTIYTTKSTWGSKYFSTLNPSKSEAGFGTDY